MVADSFRGQANTRFAADEQARVEVWVVAIGAPTTLPEGTVLDLIVDDDGDELDEQEPTALNAAISRAWASVKAGHGSSAAEVFGAIRKR